MRVFQLAPLPQKALHVDLLDGRFCRIVFGRPDGLLDGLVVVAVRVDERVVGVQVALAREKYLVDGRAVAVEELEAPAHPVPPPVPGRLDGEPEVPVVHEQAQVDVVVQHEAHVVGLGELDVPIDARLFVDGGVVARERHHRAERFELAEERVPSAVEARDVLAAPGGHELGLAHAHPGRGGADADVRMLVLERLPARF